MEDIETVIQDSIDDYQQEQVDSTLTETQSDEQVTAEEPTEGSEETQSDESQASALTPTDSAVEDEFAKKHGLAAPRPGERENRLPYSRVKKIVENAEKRALAPFQKQVTEFQAKVTDYEGRLQRVAQFEQIMLNDPTQFLNLLVSRIPAYKAIFDNLSKGGQPQGSQVARSQTQQQVANPSDEMPGPDQVLPDGSRVYSLEGLAARDRWNREQAKKAALEEFDKRFKPFEEARERAQREAVLERQVNAQIEEARTWPQFKENEADITKALAANPRLTLEAAYRQVVIPKLSTNYNALRTKVLQEVKKAPASTSVVSSATKPGQIQSTGKRSTEDIIWESIGKTRPTDDY